MVAGEVEGWLICKKLDTANDPVFEDLISDWYCSICTTRSMIPYCADLALIM